MQYRYPRFQGEVMEEEMSFVRGPRPGEPFPDFELLTTDGGRVRKGDFVGPSIRSRTPGGTDDVLGAAGGQARSDFRQTLPPVYGLARLCALYRPLPPPGRGIAGVATTLLAIGLVAVYLARRR